MTKCEFSTCTREAEYIGHDKRACRNVCFEHARFLRGTSQVFDHSAGCPNAGEVPFRRITRMAGTEPS